MLRRCGAAPQRLVERLGGLEAGAAVGEILAHGPVVVRGGRVEPVDPRQNGLSPGASWSKKPSRTMPSCAARRPPTTLAMAPAARGPDESGRRSRARGELVHSDSGRPRPSEAACPAPGPRRRPSPAARPGRRARARPRRDGVSLPQPWLAGSGGSDTALLLVAVARLSEPAAAPVFLPLRLLSSSSEPSSREATRTPLGSGSRGRA